MYFDSLMMVIEIERHESPYSKNYPHSSLSPSHMVAAGGGCCSCCCCCCSTSTFILPEALILSSIIKKSALTKNEIFHKYLLIYGISFGIIFALGLIVSLVGGGLSGSIIFLLVIGVIGALGSLIINPIVVNFYCRTAIDSAEDTRPIGLFVFLIGFLSLAIYSGTIVPIVLGSM